MKGAAVQIQRLVSRGKPVDKPRAVRDSEAIQATTPGKAWDHPLPQASKTSGQKVAPTADVDQVRKALLFSLRLLGLAGPGFHLRIRDAMRPASTDLLLRGGQLAAPERGSGGDPPSRLRSLHHGSSEARWLFAADRNRGNHPPPHE